MATMSTLNRRLIKSLPKASEISAMQPLENPVAYHIEQCLYAGNGNYRLLRLHLRAALGECIEVPNPFEVIAEVRVLRDIADDQMAQTFIDSLIKEARALIAQGQTRQFAWQLFLPKKPAPFTNPLRDVLSKMETNAKIVLEAFAGTTPQGTNQILAAQLLAHVRYLLKQAEGKRDERT